MDERLNAPVEGLEVPPAHRARAERRGASWPSAFTFRTSTWPRAGVEKGAAEAIPVHVLERVGALPYRIAGNQLKIAVADPTNVQAIDEPGSPRATRSRSASHPGRRSTSS